MAKKVINGDFRIENPNIKLKEELQNIAAHKGTTLTAFLRGVFIETRDKYPEHMRKPVKKD